MKGIIVTSITLHLEVPYEGPPLDMVDAASFAHEYLRTKDIGAIGALVNGVTVNDYDWVDYSEFFEGV